MTPICWNQKKNHIVEKFTEMVSFLMQLKDFKKQKLVKIKNMTKSELIYC